MNFHTNYISDTYSEIKHLEDKIVEIKKEQSALRSDMKKYIMEHIENYEPVELNEDFHEYIFLLKNNIVLTVRVFNKDKVEILFTENHFSKERKKGGVKKDDIHF